MKIHQLAAALQVLREAITGSIPRVAACHARLVEVLARVAQREQLHAMILCESSGAYQLEEDDLAALRKWRSDPHSQLDLSRAPRLLSGRAHYEDTADFATFWLGINCHQTSARLVDAHLLIACRHSNGQEITPHHARLAELVAHLGYIELRRILGHARAMEKFKLRDTAHDGLPLPAIATHSDAMLSGAHIVEALQEPNCTTNEKHVSALFASYRQQHEPVKPNPVGLFRPGKCGTASCWKLLAEERQVEAVYSMSCQADNARTDTGEGTCPNNSHRSDEGLFSSSRHVPDWAGISYESLTRNNFQEKLGPANPTSLSVTRPLMASYGACLKPLTGKTWIRH